MDDILIDNFCGNKPLELCARMQGGTIGPLVTLSQSAGGMNFQHDLKPEQARAMAAALLTCANVAERLAAETAAAAP